MTLLNRIKKLKNPRLRTLYRLCTNLLPILSLPPKPEIDLTFLSMCGPTHLQLLQQCLLSLHSSWSALPRLKIVSDGTVSISTLERTLSWWNGSKSFSVWEESLEYHRRHQRTSLVRFAENNVVGRKLATILEAGECGATLWCDTDVLWFDELPGLLELLAENNSSILLKLSEDYQPAYDNYLFKHGLAHLKHQPYINSGIVYLRGNLIDSCTLQPWLNLAAEHSSHFSEQTILAEAAYQLRTHLWSKDEIACFANDARSAWPKYTGKQWSARHYVGPVRHLFWRDALALRLGLKQQLFNA